MSDAKSKDREVNGRSLEEIDRNARGYERAVLSHSMSGEERAPLILNRTFASLAALRVYMDEVPSTCLSSAGDYLAMVCLFERGNETNLEEIDPWTLSVDEVEKLLRAAPMMGAPRQRQRTYCMKIALDASAVDAPEYAELIAEYFGPVLADGEVFEEDDEPEEGQPWTFSQCVDSDELRLDASEGQLTFTHSFPNAEIAIERLTECFARLAENFGSYRAVLYDLDLPQSRRYLGEGLAAGRPGIFLICGDAPFPVRTFDFDGDIVHRAEATDDVIAKLDPDWPHEIDWDEPA